MELDNVEINFYYVKSSESEWNESLTNTLSVTLNEEQINYVKEFVSSFNGGSDEYSNFNYSKDFIMTDEHERIEKEIGDILDTITSEYEPETDNEVGEWFNYQNEEPMFDDDNTLLVEMNNETTIYKVEEN